jgi:hypothetical protein
MGNCACAKGDPALNENQKIYARVEELTKNCVNELAYDALMRKKVVAQGFSLLPAPRQNAPRN